MFNSSAFVAQMHCTYNMHVVVQSTNKLCVWRFVYQL